MTLKHELPKAEFESKVEAFKAKGTGLWDDLTAIVSFAVHHANFHNHAPDRVRTVLNAAKHIGNSTMVTAVKAAVFECTAMKPEWDKEKKAFVTTFEKSKWEEIKKSGFAMVVVLDTKGVRGFKAPKAAKSTEYNVVDIVDGNAKKFHKLWAELREIEGVDGADVMAFTTRLTELTNELEKLVVSKRELQKLAEATGAVTPDKPEEQTAEEGSKVPDYEAELEELQEELETLPPESRLYKMTAARIAELEDLITTPVTQAA